MLAVHPAPVCMFVLARLCGGGRKCLTVVSRVNMIHVKVGPLSASIKSCEFAAHYYTTNKLFVVGACLTPPTGTVVYLVIWKNAA